MVPTIGLVVTNVIAGLVAKTEEGKSDIRLAGFLIFIVLPVVGFMVALKLERYIVLRRLRAHVSRHPEAINRRWEHDRPPLAHAIGLDDANACRWLLERGASPHELDTPTGAGWVFRSVLASICFSGIPEKQAVSLVRQLLAAGANPGGHPQDSPRKPLSWALSKDRWQLAHVLIAAGAHVSADNLQKIDRSGPTRLKHAVR
ncbi:MAG TPA: ankyrin repeat domain-containing protein [Candidatus Xenobia bacterium]